MWEGMTGLCLLPLEDRVTPRDGPADGGARGEPSSWGVLSCLIVLGEVLGGPVRLGLDAAREPRKGKAEPIASPHWLLYTEQLAIP